jgi:hypothetical protein
MTVVSGQSTLLDAPANGRSHNAGAFDGDSSVALSEAGGRRIKVLVRISGVHRSVYGSAEHSRRVRGVDGKSANLLVRIQDAPTWTGWTDRSGRDLGGPSRTGAGGEADALEGGLLRAGATAPLPTTLGLGCLTHRLAGVQRLGVFGGRPGKFFLDHAEV